MKVELGDSDEADRLTIKGPSIREPGAGMAPLRRPDVMPDARSLRDVPLTPRLLMACAYFDVFEYEKRWNTERIHVVMRALGFSPQDIVDARTVVHYRRDR